MSDNDRTTDIKLQVSSVFDNTGTNAAQQGLDQTADAAAKLSHAADSDGLRKSMEDMNGELRVSRLLLKDMKEGVENFTDGLKNMLSYVGKATGMVTILSVGIRTLKGVYDYFTADARKAHAAQAEAIRKATEEAAKMQKQLIATIAEAKALSDLKYAQDKIATLTQAYKDHTTELQHQLEIERKRAAIQAEMRGYKTQAEKYELDNKLDRGEIGINEHRDQVRALEDKDRNAKYAAEIGEVTKELDNLRDQAKLAGENLKTFQTDLDELNKGKGIVLSKVEEETLDARKTSNDTAITWLEKKIAKMESDGLQNTQSYRERINQYNWFDRDNAAIAAKKKASKDWLAQDGHGGNYETWKTMRDAADENVQQTNKEINAAVKAIQELKTTLDGIEKTKTAEEEMVASNRKNEDATNETKDMRTMPVKQAVEQLTKEKTDLVDAAKLLQDSAKRDADALADASQGMTDAAKAAKSFGDVGEGKEAQDVVAAIQKAVKHSGDLAGKEKNIAAISAALQKLLQKGMFDPQQANDLQEVVRVLTSMAETQTAQKDNADKTAALDKAIAEFNNMETVRRNTAEDKAAYERIADALIKRAQQQQATVEADSAAAAALKTGLDVLADKQVTPEELPAIVGAIQTLEGATDAASIQTRDLLTKMLIGLGSAANRINKQTADMATQNAEINRINASLAYPSK